MLGEYRISGRRASEIAASVERGVSSGDLPPGHVLPPMRRMTHLEVDDGLVQEVGPTTAQMVTYFIPVIATAAGVALLGEQLSWNTPVGALIVLVGAALARPPAPRRRQHPDWPPTPEGSLPAAPPPTEHAGRGPRPPQP
ncbi:hypothetical protein SBADM41S_00314 [Streptomyces badius]